VQHPLCRAIFQYRSAGNVIGQRRAATWPKLPAVVNFSSKAKQDVLLVPGQRQT
jgi:hypothetical protein